MDHQPDIQNMTEMPWTSVGKPGLYRKDLRADLDTGKFLGLLRFDADATSGIHRHLDTAVSYILGGSVTDCMATFRQGDVGVNPPGDTHDALSYDGAVMVSRLEGATIYTREEDSTSTLQAIHPGAYTAELVGEAERSTDCLPISLQRQPLTQSGCPGLQLRLLYDYRRTGRAVSVPSRTSLSSKEIPVPRRTVSDSTSMKAVSVPSRTSLSSKEIPVPRRTVSDSTSMKDYRMVSLHFLAGSHIPTFHTTAQLDLFIIAGDLLTDQGPAYGNHFVTARPNSIVSLSSRYGCHLLAWSEGPIQYAEPNARHLDPFGFC
jgi:hypothetical protein